MRQIAKEIKDELNIQIDTQKVDADSVEELVALGKKNKTDIVLNVALAYQDFDYLWTLVKTGRVHYGRYMAIYRTPRELWRKIGGYKRRQVGQSR